MAAALGFETHEVCFVANTTSAVATFAQATVWRAGDQVVVHEDEVPSNVLPWRATGAEVVRLPSRDGRLELADLAAALTSGRVRVVAIAAVALPTGDRRDLAGVAELVRASGAVLAVDGAQAVGAVALGGRPDAVFGCSRKWLLGPPGIGFMAIREPAIGPLRVPNGGGRSIRAALPDRVRGWR